MSFSVFIAGIIAIFRYKKIASVYYPFLICIWIACINEALSYFIIKVQGRSNLVTINIYVLIEAILITFLFKKLKTFKRSEFLFYSIIGAFIIWWGVDNFILNTIKEYDVYFRIFYSFIIVLMSISTINEMIVHNNKRNATFLLCIAFVFYFTFKVFVYAIWISGLSQDFLRNLFGIMAYVNLITNLIYGVAILWMPRRLEFSLPY